MSVKKEILKKINDNIIALPQACADILIDNTEILDINKKAHLINEGQYSSKTYYVVSGSLRAYYLKDGQDITDWFAFENEFITSIQCFFKGLPSYHYIQAMEDTTVLSINQSLVIELSDQYRAFERLTKMIITNTMLKLQERVVSLQFESAQSKYNQLLDSHPDIELKVPLIYIASYLGITIETLSRIRRNNLT